MSVVKKRVRARIAAFATALGVDPRLLANPLQIPRFIRDALIWKNKGGVIHSLYPCVGDWHAQAGSVPTHYFLQDILVATLIHSANPPKHVDVGSRLDGFVAHLACFREVEVFDVRPLDLELPNISFQRWDLADPDSDLNEITPSLSCLHALEHFGLGRYGDSIDPLAHLTGFNNLCRLLARGGVLYFSVPVAQVERVEFNAHRVFRLADPIVWAADKLSLERCWVIDDEGRLHTLVHPTDFRAPLWYGCAIYQFRKVSPADR